MQPGKNYEPLLKRIKDYGAWAKLSDSAYLILTDSTPVAVRDNLVAVLDANDKIFVGNAPAPAAWRGLPDDVSKWIIANQRA
jgi:hypothetical protein